MPPPSLQAPLAIQPLQRKQTVAGIYEGPPPHPGLNPSLGPRAREGSGPEADGVQPGDLPPSKRPKGT